MGGFGSGRSGGRPTIENCRALVLDIDQLVREGRGKPVICCEITGTLGGPLKIAVRLQRDADGTGTLAIAHGAFQHASAAVPAAFYKIEVEGTPCRLGGYRWQFVCPTTGAAVRKLYLPNGAARFASRRAFGLAYQSQRLGPIGLSHARLARAYAKLGVAYHTFRQPVPPRPKRMRVQTYQRLVDQIEALQQVHGAAADAAVRRAFPQI